MFVSSAESRSSSPCFVVGPRDRHSYGLFEARQYKVRVSPYNSCSSYTSAVLQVTRWGPQRVHLFLSQRGSLQMSKLISHLSIARRSALRFHLQHYSCCGWAPMKTRRWCCAFPCGATHSPVPEGKVFLRQLISPAGVSALWSSTCPSTQAIQASTPTECIQLKFPFRWQSTKICIFFHLAPEPSSPPASPSLLETPLLCLTPALLSHTWWRGVSASMACVAFVVFFLYRDKEHSNVCLLFLLV